MPNHVSASQLIRFATFEVDLQAQELRKGGLRLKLSGQPFQVLAILLEKPGVVVTREELQKRLWPDTFVDVDHNLNTAINKIREVLGDSAESPRFVETLPRRGYRFIAPAKERDELTGARYAEESVAGMPGEPRVRSRILRYSVMAVVLSTAAGSTFLIYKKPLSGSSRPRALTRLTFGAGLQMEPTWSPDGRYIAYTSDLDGKLDVWVQQVSGANPVRVTHTTGNNWQPSWSPDGKYIAYRSEGDRPGLFAIPALGGEGLERRITSFGYRPRWSPDGSQILFQTLIGLTSPNNSFYVVGLDGSPPRDISVQCQPQEHLKPGAIMWHPDGKSFSVWAYNPLVTLRAPKFWTVPVSGGPPRAWEIPPEITKQLDEISVSGTPAEIGADTSFSWAPSGDAIYFARAYKGATNIWKMSVDLATLRAKTIERMTTGSGSDTDPVVSPDGKRLAFSTKSERIGAWLFPFNATLGRITGSGWAATSPGMEAWLPNLSHDGMKLAFQVNRGGQPELWEKSLVDGHEHPIFADDYLRDFPQWSRDGKRLFYRRIRVREGRPEGQLILWSEADRKEEPLTELSTAPSAPYDWSADGKSVLASERGEIWQLPVDAAPNAEAAAIRVASSPMYKLWQSHFSPDERWIVFGAEAVHASREETTIYVVPKGGGAWMPITEKNHWYDKPRWSPDGKTIYYVMDQNGLFNVWGTHFDPAQGMPVGQPFQVTTFDSPKLMFPSLIEPVEISIGGNKLALTLEEASGSIWVLDNVDR